jgi:hypothetical protein
VNNFEEPDYEAAVKVCRGVGRISVSAIQRHLHMGYVKACVLVEAMGERGIAERVDPDGAWVFTSNNICQDALDYDHTHHCRVCGKPVRIRVRNLLSAVLVLGHWNEKMGGKCKACLEIGG